MAGEKFAVFIDKSTADACADAEIEHGRFFVAMLPFGDGGDFGIIACENWDIEAGLEGCGEISFIAVIEIIGVFEYAVFHPARATDAEGIYGEVFGIYGVATGFELIDESFAIYVLGGRGELVEDFVGFADEGGFDGCATDIDADIVHLEGSPFGLYHAGLAT